MGNNKQINENEYFLISNNFVKDLLSELSKDFKYKNILILGLNNTEIEMQMRKNRHLFCFAFSYKNIMELHENTDCVVIFNNAITLENIKKCINNNIKMFLINENYLTYDYFSFIKQNNALNLLMRIIINNNYDDKQKSILYCNYLMDKFSLKVHIFEDLLNAMFFKSEFETSNYDFNNEETIVDYKDFSVEEVIKTTVKFGLSFNITNILNKPYVEVDIVSFKFLMSQILLNIYKNFIALIKPTLIGKFENFTFNYEKFWFVKEQCESVILQEIEKFEQFALLIKQQMAKINVDYYYEICKQFINFDCKQRLLKVAKEYEKVSILKVIYEMGLLEF